MYESTINREIPKSEYFGVSWYRNTSNWRAAIRVNKKFVYIGQFSDEQEAAIAVNTKMRELGLPIKNTSVEPPPTEENNETDSKKVIIEPAFWV